MKKGSLIKRVAPFAVLAAALSFSAWSLYFVSRHLGAPIPVAVVVSTIFDGSAIYLADIGADHTREGDSGFGPRFAVFILAGISAWLNMLHAQYGHYPVDSELLWGAPPVVAVVVYEFTIRHLYRKTLRATGRIPAAMQRFDSISWLLFPVKTLKATRKVVEYRREVATSMATGELLPGTPATSVRTPELFAQLPPGTAPNPRDVREWARRTGLRVGQTGPLPAELVSRYTRAIASGESAQGGDGQEDGCQEANGGHAPAVINGHNFAEWGAES